MKKIQDSGKVKYLVLSECSAETLRRACKVVHIDAVQMEYSPFSMDIEEPQIGLLEACRELGVATVTYSPSAEASLPDLSSHRMTLKMETSALPYPGSQPRISTRTSSSWMRFDPWRTKRVAPRANWCSYFLWHRAPM